MSEPERAHPTVVHSRAFNLRGFLGGMVFVPAMGIAVFSTSNVAPGSVAALIYSICAWVFFVLYATFRIWATLYLGGHKDRVLQTTGIYAATRNPLYFGTRVSRLASPVFSKASYCSPPLHSSSASTFLPSSPAKNECSTNASAAITRCIKKQRRALSPASSEIPRKVR